MERYQTLLVVVPIGMFIASALSSVETRTTILNTMVRRRKKTETPVEPEQVTEQESPPEISAIETTVNANTGNEYSVTLIDEDICLYQEFLAETGVQLTIAFNAKKGTCVQLVDVRAMAPVALMRPKAESLKQCLEDVHENVSHKLLEGWEPPNL